MLDIHMLKILYLAFVQLVQVTLLILLVTIIVRFTARDRPHLAYLLWMLVVVKCLTPPVWSSQFSVFSRMVSSVDSESVVRPIIDSLDDVGEERRIVVSEPASPLVRSQSIIQPSSHGNTVQQEPVSGQAFPVVQEPVVSSQPLAQQAALENIKAHPARRSLLWPVIIIGIWLIGTALVLLMALVQWLLVLWKIRAATLPDDPEIEALVQRLAKRLGLRRTPRVRIVSHLAIAPAVVGFVRPTILLPDSVCNNLSPDQLEMIVAHELMHIRRGDVWAGLLQIAAQGVWWFHPLVWRAGRQLILQADRCCDEAMLAQLNCKPADYADCLLDVIECRSGMNVLSFPVVPGAGSARGIAQRLERIMKKRNGFCKRTPWWCWVIALAAAVTVLPGAAMVLSEDAGDHRQLRDEPQMAWTMKEQPEQVMRQIAPEPTQVVQFNVSDLIKQMMQREQLTREEAKQLIQDRMEPLGGFCRYQTSWIDNRLVVHESGERLEQINSILDLLRRDEKCQITVAVLFMTGSDQAINEGLGGKQWSALPLSKEQRDEILASWKTTGNSQFIEANQKLHQKLMLLTEDETFRLIAACQADVRSNILQAPKLTVREGQKAEVADVSQTNVVVDAIPVVGDYATAYQPVIETLEEGTRLQVRATRSGDDAVRLDFRCLFSNIEEIASMPLFGAEYVPDTVEKDVSCFEVLADEEKKIPDYDPQFEASTVTTKQNRTMHNPVIQCPTIKMTTAGGVVDIPSGHSLLLEGHERLVEVRDPKSGGFIESLARNIMNEPHPTKRVRQKMLMSLRTVKLPPVKISEELPADGQWRKRLDEQQGIAQLPGPASVNVPHFGLPAKIDLSRPAIRPKEAAARGMPVSQRAMNDVQYFAPDQAAK